MNELRQRFGQPILIVNGFIVKLIDHQPLVPKRSESYFEFSAFINTMVHTSKEHGSKANLKHATDKLPHTEALKWNHFLITRGIDHPTLETYIAPAFERLPPSLPNRLVRNDTVKVSTENHSETFNVSYVEQHQRKQNHIGNRIPNKGGDQPKYTDSTKQAFPSKNIQNGTYPMDDGRQASFNCPHFREKSSANVMKM